LKRPALTARVLLIACLGAAILWLGFHRQLFETAALESALVSFGPWAPIVFILLYTIASVLFVPGSVLTLAGGALFGPVWGTIWNLAGATIGATVAFLISRYIGADWVRRRAGERLARVIRGVEDEGWRFVAFVRLVPLFPFNLLNYALGLTRIGVVEYAITSFVCMTPAAVAYTYLGYAGRAAAFGQAGAIHKALLALALIAAVGFLPRLLRRLREIRYTEPAKLEELLRRGQSLALIDVRTAEEFRGPLGHIAGAINIPISELSGRIAELCGLKRPLVTI
jgi:uncharacterized membrane protein YdjX (TVP38/TMEM64 family)